MKTISIHQPWAWAILHGGKAVENRTWPTRYRGPLLIHASKSRESYERQDAGEWLQRYGVELPSWDSMAKGAIVGIVDLVGCVNTNGEGQTDRQREWLAAHPYTEGPWCWVLKNPRAFAEPLSYRGAQSLFEVPDSLIANRLI